MKKADSLAMAGDKKFIGKIIEYSEKYLYEPNSPYLDDSFLLLFFLKDERQTKSKTAVLLYARSSSLPHFFFLGKYCGESSRELGVGTIRRVWNAYIYSSVGIHSC